MSQDDGKQVNQKKEPPVQGSKTGGFIKILKNAIKSLFNSVIDMQQHTLQQQEQLKKMQTQQDLDVSGNSPENQPTEEKQKVNPENLPPKAKQEAKEAAEGLKKRIKLGSSDKSIEAKVPGETPALGINSEDNQKNIER